MRYINALMRRPKNIFNLTMAVGNLIYLLLSLNETACVAGTFDDSEVVIPGLLYIVDTLIESLVSSSSYSKGIRQSCCFSFSFRNIWF